MLRLEKTDYRPSLKNAPRFSVHTDSKSEYLRCGDIILASLLGTPSANTAIVNALNKSGVVV